MEYRKNNNNLYVVKKSKRVEMIYFDKENHDIEETNTETFDHVSKYVCHQRLHRVTNDQKIANDLILQLKLMKTYKLNVKSIIKHKYIYIFAR